MVENFECLSREFFLPIRIKYKTKYLERFKTLN